MKKHQKIFMFVGYLILFSFFAIQQAKADDHQPPPSTCLPTDPDYDPRLCVPIDGGLSFLLIAGVGYGVYKNRSSWKKTQEKSTSFF